MKNLKHIQLFEAFESTILSKTLGYIKETNDRNKFLEQIKNLCQTIDYPLSKMSDEFFEYLPFKKALSKASMTGDEPCEATSRSEFPEYEVEGAKCEKGKIKRKWGARTREVVCPVCNGTGIKPKKPEMKLLKFWFTAEGKYVTTTAVDGMIRPNLSSDSAPTGFSIKLSDYIVGDRVDHRSVENGKLVKIDIEGYEMVAYIFKQGGTTYAIQNKKNGSSPSGRDWQKYGRYSWSLGSGEYRFMHLLTPKNKDIVEEADPYTWNVGIDLRYRSSIRLETKNIQSSIKDAHFAIVFDFGKLKKSEFETKSDMQTSREEAKKGSKLDPSQSDEEVKRRNIERYVNLLSQKLDITQDISNCNRLVSRALGGKRGALFIVYGSDIYSKFSYIINDYLKLLSTNDDREKEQHAEEISQRAENFFKSGMRTTNSTQETIKEIKTRIKSNNLDEDYTKVLEVMEELSGTIFDTINNFQIDSIEDFEVLNQKISSIRNVLKADRYNLSRFMSYVVDSIINSRPGRAYDYLTDTYYLPNVNLLITNLQRVKTIISKI